MKITVAYEVDVDLDAQAAHSRQSAATELADTLHFLREAAPRFLDGQSFMAVVEGSVRVQVEVFVPEPGPDSFKIGTRHVDPSMRTWGEIDEAKHH